MCRSWHHVGDPRRPRRLYRVLAQSPERRQAGDLHRRQPRSEGRRLSARLATAGGAIMTRAPFPCHRRQALPLEGHSSTASRATGRRRSRAGKPTGVICNLARRPPAAHRTHGGRALSGTERVRKLGRASARSFFALSGRVLARGSGMARFNVMGLMRPRYCEYWSITRSRR